MLKNILLVSLVVFFIPSWQIDEKMAVKYQKVMSEWKACEVIVKQREKESHSTAFSKFSSGSSIDSHVLRLIHRDSTISNEVSLQSTPLD